MRVGDDEGSEARGGGGSAADRRVRRDLLREVERGPILEGCCCMPGISAAANRRSTREVRRLESRASRLALAGRRVGLLGGARDCTGVPIGARTDRA